MATIPGNAFIDLCAANAAETFRRRWASSEARARRNLEAQRQGHLKAAAEEWGRREAAKAVARGRLLELKP